MSYQSFKFKFSELNIDPHDIISLMGYDEEIPPQITACLHEEMLAFEHLEEIEGGITTRKSNIDLKENAITIEHQQFNVGKRITRLLKKAEYITGFICTAGRTIPERSKKLMEKGDLIEGYVVDVIGNVAVETAMDRIQQLHQSELEAKGLKITNRYSPGYCNWSVADQPKLFSLFPKNFCGVSLTPSCLMLPIKSISGFIGVGEHVCYEKYTCTHCTMQNCIYRGKR